MGQTSPNQEEPPARAIDIPGNEDRQVAVNNDRFYIYSTKAGKSDGPNAHVVSGTAVQVDAFLDLLPEKGVALKSKPTGVTTDLDDGDKWATWMSNLGADWEDSHTVMSVTVDNVTELNIQWFTFHMTAPWNLAFSSSDAAILFAYGVDPATQKSRVAQPGLPDNGTPMYFGLDPQKTPEDVEATVAQVFQFANLEYIAEHLPKALGERAVTLGLHQAAEQRNAMWFRPERNLMTSVRLRFVLNGTQELESMVTSVLPGLQFNEAAILVKKSMYLGSFRDKPQAMPVGEVDFEIDCQVTADNKTADFLAGFRVFTSGYSLTLQVKSKDGSDPLSVIVAWFLGLLPQGSGVESIKDILTKEDFFTNYIHLRQVKVDIDTTGEKMALNFIEVNIEISTGSFGQGSDQSKRIPFLVTYTWSRFSGGAGTIQGRFWNDYDASPNRILSPLYEPVTDLLPITKDPASSIDLPSLIAGHTIENIPDNVPTKLTRARILLSTTGFGFQAAIQSKKMGQTEKSTVPQLDLGMISLQASFVWGKKSDFNISLGIRTLLEPGKNSKHQETASLLGSLAYSSTTGWKLKASVNDLYGSNLYEMFDPESAGHVIPLIDSLVIKKLQLDYQYANGVGSEFKFDGLILIAALQLKLNFTFKDKQGWKFTATLEAQDAKATLGDILASILPGDDLELPSFLANTPVSGQDKGGINLEVTKNSGPSGMFQFVASIGIADLTLTFAQIHLTAWGDNIPSKRFIKVALTGMPHIGIPLIGDIPQPYDEIYLMWVQDNTKKNIKMPGLTREEIRDLNLTLTKHPLVAKDKFSEKKDADVLISAGSRFAIITKDSSGKRTAILDYDFKKSTSKNSGKGGKNLKASGDGEGKSDSDGNSSSAPFKKKAGPLSISNIGLKYAGKTLHVTFTATFNLGPLEFSLIGFSLNLEVTGLKEIRLLPPSLEGLAVSFEKSPLTIAGIIRHGKDKDLDYYAGGLIIGWTPYQVQAAGFYGTARDQSKGGDATFTSVFVFARLDGPLVTLEFAEISGVTGGFGYNSSVRTPAPDQITNFPFIKTTTLDGAGESAIQTLERLTSPKADGWFAPLNDTYWAAAGMKIDAFQMVALTAVAVIQFGQSVTMGIYAVALVDIPDSLSKMKFAHVELGIAAVVDLDHGVLKVEAQLSPNSYILHPDCHLTGGFGLYYWFDAPHADRSLVGDFVFTLGGYHQAFKVPQGYPNPPRLGIKWNLGSHLSIKGEAYFAITPKVAMAGGRLHAAFSAGPVDAWFDAFADFLINYKPFFFQASAGVSIGIKLSLDIGPIHLHKSYEVGADLSLWGPPLAGRVHIDLKVYKFSINFGDSSSSDHAVSLMEFYKLVLQPSSQKETRSSQARVTEVEDEDVDRIPDNQGHTFLAQSGLMNDKDKPQRDVTEAWIVRGGTFSFIAGCKMAISSSDLQDLQGKVLSHVEYNDKSIYARPMKITQGLKSTMKISITQDESNVVGEWTMDRYFKSVPRGLWDQYSQGSDPAKSGNNISSMLDADDAGVMLMMGVELTAPPPKMSEDKLQTFKILDAQLESIPADKFFPVEKAALRDWDAVEPLADKEQFGTVHDKWASPDWNMEEAGSSLETGVQKSFVSRWAEAFNWDANMSNMAKLPKRLDKRFGKLYLGAPQLTK